MREGESLYPIERDDCKDQTSLSTRHRGGTTLYLVTGAVAAIVGDLAHSMDGGYSPQGGLPFARRLCKEACRREGSMRLLAARAARRAALRCPSLPFAAPYLAKLLYPAGCRQLLLLLYLADLNRKTPQTSDPRSPYQNTRR
jgi:hypothetical protein